MSDKDVDAQFADIVAHWDDVAAPPEAQPPGYAAPTRPEGTAPTPPASEPAEQPGDDPKDQPGSQPTDLGLGINPPPEIGFVVWRGSSAPAGHEDDTHDELVDSEDDEEHFHPGPTAPLPPQEDLQFWGIIVGLVAGPLLLLWLVIFHPAVSGWWTLGALGLSIGGFVLLVMRQPHSRDEDDPDNGARI